MCDVEVANSGHVLQAHWSGALPRLLYCNRSAVYLHVRCAGVIESRSNDAGRPRSDPQPSHVLRLHSGRERYIEQDLPIWLLVTHTEPVRKPGTLHTTNRTNWLHNPIRRPESTPRDCAPRMLYTNSKSYRMCSSERQVISPGPVSKRVDSA